LSRKSALPRRARDFHERHLEGSGAVTLAILPPLSDWVDVRRQLTLEVCAGERIILKESQLPRGVPITIKNRLFILTATQAGNPVHVELVEAKPGVNAVSNR
jgi:hypothetical protein